MRIVTVLEYVEVFVEMTAQRLWGQTGRWIAITAIQVAKLEFTCFISVIGFVFKTDDCLSNKQSGTSSPVFNLDAYYHQQFCQVYLGGKKEKNFIQKAVSDNQINPRFLFSLSVSLAFTEVHLISDHKS